MSDILKPSDAALKELNMPEYLRACGVTARTIIQHSTITYDVRVGDWFVWSRTGEFGRDDAHRAAGAAFVGLSQEQQSVMHEWADKILFALEAS